MSGVQRVELCRERDGRGETRLVEMRLWDQGIELFERTSGPDTLAIFGDVAHLRVLRLEGAAERAFWALVGGASVGEGVRAGFAMGRFEWLSDVQDVLDRAGVRYHYAAYGPDGAQYRPLFDLAWG